MLPLWLTIQMLALGLAAGRVPLYARFPMPVERAATVEILCAQFITAALLFTTLLRGPTRWLWVVAASWPMLTLAGLLGEEPARRLAATGAYLTGWLTMLSLFATLLKTPQQKAIATAIAALWTIGGPILLYLHAEYGGAADLWPPNHSNIPYALAGGPIWAALYHLNARHLLLFSDIPLVILLVLAFVLMQMRNREPLPTAASQQ